jgi:hypothetical protein
LSVKGRGRENGRVRKVPARVRSGDVVLVTLLGAALLLIFNFSPSEIFSYLYHPVSGVIALLLIIQFLWLKSTDRTRIYRMEIDRLRRLRRADEDLLKQCRTAVSAGSADSADIKPLLDRLNERL